MKQYMSKTRGNYRSGVVRPKIIDKTHFELKGQFLKELRENTFSGLEHEDVKKHFEKVPEIVDLFHIPEVTQDQVMLRIFPMSLTGATSRWLRNEPSGSITNWETLKTKFLNKYYPPARTAKKMTEINNFQQEPDESLFQAWERFKELFDMWVKSSVSQSASPIFMTKTFCASNSVENLDTLSSVRRPKPSGVIWMKKGSSNTVKADLSSVNHSNLNKNVKRYSRKNLMACNNSDTRSAFDIVQICLWIIDSGCSKHMTGNRALLMNFVEKFFGTVRFGNNNFAMIAGYGDMVIGSMTIKKVYCVEGL
uniref:Uncharacterized protein n=1 Tax=Tanacetum cinerariifolium TaxID=118510 RepID=A0A6L2MVS2_TANCI|nr:hypothetical protein [Tanacetum cinerariifolium]